MCFARPESESYVEFAYKTSAWPRLTMLRPFDHGMLDSGIYPGGFECGVHGGPKSHIEEEERGRDLLDTPKTFPRARLPARAARWVHGNRFGRPGEDPGARQPPATHIALSSSSFVAAIERPGVGGGSIAPVVRAALREFYFGARPIRFTKRHERGCCWRPIWSGCR